jgi:hypothetical protein
MKEMTMSKSTTSHWVIAMLLLAPSVVWASTPGGGGSGAGSRDEDYNYFRIDCRYHSHDRDHDHDSDHGSDKSKMSGEKGNSNGFCYASAVYRIDDREFKDVHMAIGCDGHTLYNDGARVHIETTLDRFQPPRAATPAIEVFPHGQLATEGTYTSVLDISFGRIKGLCYVHSVKYDNMGRKY